MPVSLLLRSILPWIHNFWPIVQAWSHTICSMSKKNLFFLHYIHYTIIVIFPNLNNKFIYKSSQLLYSMITALTSLLDQCCMCCYILGWRQTGAWPHSLILTGASFWQGIASVLLPLLFKMMWFYTHSYVLMIIRFYNYQLIYCDNIARHLINEDMEIFHPLPFIIPILTDAIVLTFTISRSYTNRISSYTGLRV